MSDASSFGFGKFIPGFDFLQGLAQSAGSATARPLGRLPEWVAPTVSIEEVDKRITELKAVQFWLEQNGKALAATIQALEVQRMTLSTLQGMNVSMGELAQAFQFPAAAATAAAATAASGTPKDGKADHSDWPMSAGRKTGVNKADGKERTPPAQPSQATQAPAEAAAAAGHQPEQPRPSPDAGQEPPAQAAAMGQAMQWWGALTQQFQQIAAKAMAEPLAPEAMAAAQRATGMAGDFAKAAMERMAAQTEAFASQASQAAKTSKASKTSKAPAASPRPAPAAQPSGAATSAAGKKPAARPAVKKPAAAQEPAKAPAATKAARKTVKTAASSRTTR